MLVLSRDDVVALLDLDALVDAVARAMVELSAGRTSVPPRVAATAQRGGLLAAMPAHIPAAGVLETKLVSVFPQNAGTELPTHQAVIVCFDPSTGEPVALMDAAYVTEVRTAAGSVLSMRALARPGSSVLAVLGTGVQARAHARAAARVLDLREIRIAGRSQEHAAALAAELSGEVGAEVRVVEGYESAMRGADVVSAATHSPEPVVRREWIEPGMHITSVGLNSEGPEVDADTVRDALVVVESRQAVLAPFPSGAAEFRDSGPDVIDAEIGEVVSGAHPGRTSSDQITLYRSVGVGAQDAAAAAMVLEAARGSGRGTDVPI